MLKKTIWTKEQLEDALSVKINIDGEFGKIEFNSKSVEEGDIFIAMPGNRDGHEFIADAFARGASLAIISKNCAEIDSTMVVKVENTQKALEKLAIYKRKNSSAKFIAITGSAGKTSAKESLKIMLSAYGKTYCNKGSYNNFLGCPLTIASMPDDVDYVILEMGMNGFGEIKDLVKIAVPHISLLLNVFDSHIGLLGSVDNIAKAKCEIFDKLDKDKDVAIINSDISTYDFCIEELENLGVKNIRTFGKNDSSDASFSSYEVMSDDSVRLSYNINDEEIEITVANIPIYLAENFAACFAVIDFLGLDVEKAASAIRSFKPLLGRGRVVAIERKDGINYKIICDYYNSQPSSLYASLKHFASLEGKKIIIIGGIGEIDGHEDKIYEQIIQHIKDVSASKVFLIGDMIQKIESELVKSEKFVKSYSNAEELNNEIDKYISGDELILIKGSRFLKLEKVAKYLGVENAL